jgi:hypothetical protein
MAAIAAAQACPARPATYPRKVLLPACRRTLKPRSTRTVGEIERDRLSPIPPELRITSERRCFLKDLHRGLPLRLVACSESHWDYPAPNAVCSFPSWCPTLPDASQNCSFCCPCLAACPPPESLLRRPLQGPAPQRCPLSRGLLQPLTSITRAYFSFGILPFDDELTTVSEISCSSNTFGLMADFTAAAVLHSQS